LNLRRKRSKKHKRDNLRVTRENIQNVNDCRGMDFVSDSTFHGRRFRILTIVDIFSRECLGLDVNQGIKGWHCLII
jgi:putative transposase